MTIRPFEIVLIAIFGLAGLGGLIFLANMKGNSEEEVNVYGDAVIVWGTFSGRDVQPLLSEIAKTDKGFAAVQYRSIDARSFESELVNAIAEGNSPDLVLLPHTLLVTFRSKLTPINEETLDERTFRNTYVDGAEIFRLTDGTYALPFAVDPLVLFWNRDLFSGAGLAAPPRTWENLVSDAVPRLTTMGAGRKITQSAIGMGEFINVNHAKDIISMLLIQAGVTLVEERDNRYEITLSNRNRQSTVSALKFYTQFALPESSAFTWTRTQQFDRNAFTAGKLAMYLGAGSEISSIEDENPNMNFDVVEVPQAQGATALRSYGTFYGFAIPKAARNVSGAYRAARTLTEGAVASDLARTLGLTPVLRSSFGAPTIGVYDQVLRNSALIARGWLDPAPKETTDAFKVMIDGVTSGREEIDTVINDGVYTLETLFR